MISSIKEAFHILDSKNDSVPADAIEYVHDYPDERDVTEKIVFALENAYNDKIYFDKESNSFLDTPLWYAIAAENHLSKELFEALLRLFSNEIHKEWNLLSEQCAFLIGKISNTFPYWAVPRIFDTIHDLAKTGSIAPYYWLYGVLYFADFEKFHFRMVEIFEEPFLIYPDIYAAFLAYRQIRAAIPELESRIEKLEKNSLSHEEFKYVSPDCLDEFKLALWQLQKERRVLSNDPILVKYYRTGGWKAYYKEIFGDF